MIDPQEALEAKQDKDASRFLEHDRRLEACIDGMLAKEYDGRPIELPIAKEWDGDVVATVVNRYRDSGWAVIPETDRIYTFADATDGAQ